MIRTKALVHSLLASICIAFLAISCSDNTAYIEAKELPVKGWHKDSIVNFNVPVTDASLEYNVLLNIRHNENYPSQNLWLFVNYTGPDKVTVTDTLECYLADNSGKWLGTGFGSLRSMPLLFKQKLKFKKAGNYRFSIQQGMRILELQGINDIGIELQKID